MVDSVLWRRLDRTGYEAARIDALSGGWRLAGTVVFEHEGRPGQLDCAIACAEAWTTRSGRVGGWLGERSIEAEIWPTVTAGGD